MSIGNLEQTIERVKSATPNSKIAVFTTDKPGIFKSYFDSTVRVRTLMKISPDYIGSFYGSDTKNMIFTKRTLRQFLPLEI